MVSDCPSCGYTNIRSSRIRGWVERCLNVVGVCQFRCFRCGRRFLRQVILLPGLRYSRCPKCLRQDLTDWSEPYYFPRGIARFWMLLGAKGHRCEPCRVNFVSFFSRRPPRLAPVVPSPAVVTSEALPAAIFRGNVRIVARWKTPEFYKRLTAMSKWRVRVVFEHDGATLRWHRAEDQNSQQRVA
jgi:hypothetical protein